MKTCTRLGPTYELGLGFWPNHFAWLLYCPIHAQQRHNIPFPGLGEGRGPHTTTAHNNFCALGRSGWQGCCCSRLWSEKAQAGRLFAQLSITASSPCRKQGPVQVACWLGAPPGVRLPHLPTFPHPRSPLGAPARARRQGCQEQGPAARTGGMAMAAAAAAAKRSPSFCPMDHNQLAQLASPPMGSDHVQ